ncbi:MAG: hypothetical protein QM522_11045 [Chitinophagaceae bacterium]|nr:hypothetical protein [Chitinophagaceae bacterium]
MATERHTIAAAGGRKQLRIYAETANINYFIKTALTPDVAVGATNKQVTAKATTVRQYPGDATKFNRPGSVREVLVDPSRKSGNGLPGRSFTLTADAGLPGEETRQFTYAGRMVDLHSWLSGTAKMQLHLHSSTGARYTIPAAGTTP